VSQREPEPADGRFAREPRNQTGRGIILIVVAVLVAVLVLRHHPASTASSSAAVTTVPVTTTLPVTSTTTLPATTTTTIPLATVKVQVLNGASPTQPVAGAFTAKLKAEGYATVSADNATSVVATSSIYVLVASFAPAANTLAVSLGLPTSAVVTTLPSTAPIPASTKTLGPDLVLVVGQDLASKA
jgi:hypothetical protein